jgi:hypothetical protein
MTYNVALTFRDNTVHRMGCGENLQVARGYLEDISSALLSGEKRIIFENNKEELIFVCNVNSLMFAFIEETKGDKE